MPPNYEKGKKKERWGIGFVIAVHLKQVDSQSANGRQLFRAYRLKTRKSLLPTTLILVGKICKDLKPTKIYSYQSPTIDYLLSTSKSFSTTSDNQLLNGFRGCRKVGDRSLLLCD